MADYISQFTGSEIDARLAKVPQLESGKQDNLVSGTNIKTINDQSVLGSGNLQIQVGDTDAVKYVAQTLTDAQKAQARANIDAASAAELGQIVTDLTGIEADIDSLEAAVAAINVGDYVTATTLPTASASTMGHIYLIGPDANNNYDRYFTQESSGSYSWVSLGSTQIDLSTYATQAEVDQLEAEVTDLDIQIFGLHESGNATFSTTGFKASVISGLNIRAGQSFKVKATSSDCDWERLCVIDGTAWGQQHISKDRMVKGETYTLTAVVDITALSLYLFSANTYGTITLSADIDEDVDLSALDETVNELDVSVNGKDNSKTTSIPITAGQASTYENGAYADVELLPGEYTVEHDTEMLTNSPNFYVCYEGSTEYTLIGTLENTQTLTISQKVWRVAIWAGGGACLETGNCQFVFTDNDIILGLNNEVPILSEEVNGKLDADVLKTVTSRNILNLNDPTRIQGGYIDTDGNLVQNGNTVDVDMSPLIPFVQDNGNLTLSYDGGDFARLWYGNICYYDSGKNFISATPYTTGNGIETATWFSGVAYVRFMLRHVTENINLYQIEVGTTATPFVPYSTRTEFDIPNLSITKEQIPEDAFPLLSPAVSLCGLKGGTIEVATASNTTIQLTSWPRYIKSSNIISVEAKIVSFGLVAVGTGYGETRGRYVKVDATNIYICAYGSSEDVLETVPHGLNIGTFIKVVFIINGLDNTVIVSTIDGVFRHTFTRTDTDARESYGYPTLYIDQSTELTEIKLNANCEKMQRPVWVFGDSMASEFNQRWAYYCRYSWGFNYYLDALAGGTSSQLYEDLVKSLQHGTPKYLVWMLGANDIIGGNIDNYKNTITAIMDICEKRGIELILLKQPIFQSADTTAANTWMLSLGFRYVDFYRAVGCETYGTSWYPGYLSSDNLHPDVLGAKAEASQMCIDVPEIMQ